MGINVLRAPLLQLSFVVTRKRAGMEAYLFQFRSPPNLVFHSFDPRRVFSVQDGENFSNDTLASCQMPAYSYCVSSHHTAQW